ncbi:MAG: peptidyl-prolyl cis-trans isomerase [Deltaproteobacteria bacterium]|nr:peptidyl-prolyl cis-trans isomerase [Deltaproteobacteria bacterium]
MIRTLSFARPLPAALAVVFLFCLSAAPASAELVDRVVAIVNSEVVTLSELNDLLGPVSKGIRSSEYPDEVKEKMIYSIREEILAGMVEDELARQEAKRQGITINDAAVDAAIEEMKKARQITDEDLRKGLEAEGLSWEEYREHIRNQLLRNRLVGREVNSKIVVTEEEIQDYYASHPEEFGAKRLVHLRTISRRTYAGMTPGEKDRIREELEQARKLLSGGAPFEEVERRYSDTPGKGDLGFSRVGELSPEVAQAVAGMEPGDYSDVLETGRGFMVVQLVEENAMDPKPLEEVRTEIEKKLYRQVVDERYKDWMASLKKHSYIKIIR